MQYPVPNIAWMRLVIDFIALRCILIIELVEGELLYTEDQDQRVGTPDKTAHGAFPALLMLFGFVQWLFMTAQKNEVMSIPKVGYLEDTTGM